MKHVLFISILAIFSTGCAAGGKADSQRVENAPSNFSNVKTVPDELPYSPFEIKALVEKNDSVNILQLWKRLGLEDEYFNVVGKDDFDVVKVSLDKNDSDDAVLSVWSALTSNARFVLFQQRENAAAPQEQWRYAGYVDIPDQKYSPPAFRVVQGGDKRFLVVKQITGWGTGVASYRDFFYEIKDGALKSVLDYPSKGHDINNQPWDRTYEANLIESSGAEVAVEFVVSWQGSAFDDTDSVDPLFTQTGKAFYRWDNAKNQYIYNKSKSEVTEKELDEVYNYDTIDENSFLKYTFANLLSIAENGVENQKIRLAGILKRLPNNQQKRHLESILRKKTID